MPGLSAGGEQDGRRRRRARVQVSEPELDRAAHVGRRRCSGRRRPPRRRRPRRAGPAPRPRRAAERRRRPAIAPPSRSAETTRAITIRPPIGRMQLGPSHPLAPPGGGHDRGDHVIARPSARRPAPARRRRGCAREARADGPRLRRAISSATMLTAISGTVCEPMSSPTGAATRARRVSAMPASRRLSKISWILRRLPIRPT